MWQKKYIQRPGALVNSFFLGGAIHMNRFLALFALIILLPAGVFAGEDIGRAAYPANLDKKPFDWTGYYLGAHLGYLTGDTDNDTEGLLPNGSAESWLVGIQASHRRQFSNDVVLGVGVSAPLASKDQSVTTFGNLNTVEMKGSVLGHVQLGYASGRFLPFVVGGVGAAWVEAREVLANGTASPWVDNTHLIGTIGLGINYAISDRWSTGVRYNHIWTSRERYDCGPAVCGIVGEFDLRSRTVTGTLEYRFHGPSR